MNALSFGVPALVGILLLGLARKSPIHFGGFALAYAFGEAIFIPSWEFTFHVPLFPFPLNKDDLAFLLLLAAWWYVRQKRPSSQSLSIGVDLILAGFFLGLLTVQLPVGWIDAGEIKVGAMFAGRAYFFLPLSFALWADILRRGSRDEAKDLVRTLSLLTIPLMLLYCLSAVGADIYPLGPYQTIYAGSATVVRDFLTFPHWANVAIAYFLVQLAKGKVSPHTLAALGILMAGTILTLTRSYVLPLAIMVLVASLYSIVRLRGPVRLAMPAATLVAVGAVLLLLGSFAPENLRIFGDRVAQLQASGLQGSTLAQRFLVLKAVNGFVGRIDPFFGIGFTGVGGRDPGLAPVTYWGDMMWFSILTFVGWCGVAILGGLLMVTLWKSLSIVIGRDAPAAEMGLLLTMVMVWDVSRTFAGEGYLWIPPVGTFVLALVAVEARGAWISAPVTITGIPFLRGITLNWFARDDQYAVLRRFVLVALVGLAAIGLGISVVR